MSSNIDTPIQKILYSDLEKLAMSIRDSGKRMCLVYLADFGEIKDIFGEISKHLVSCCSANELDSTDKDTCIYYATRVISVSGYTIERIEIEYPTFYQHARASENSKFHIYNGSDRFLCGGTFDELFDCQEYDPLNAIVHTVCRACEKAYLDIQGSLLGDQY